MGAEKSSRATWLLDLYIKNPTPETIRGGILSKDVNGVVRGGKKKTRVLEVLGKGEKAW
jgi:hypothetical protein